MIRPRVRIYQSSYSSDASIREVLQKVQQDTGVSFEITDPIGVPALVESPIAVLKDYDILLADNEILAPLAANRLLQPIASTESEIARAVALYPEWVSRTLVFRHGQLITAPITWGTSSVLISRRHDMDSIATTEGLFRAMESADCIHTYAPKGNPFYMYSMLGCMISHQSPFILSAGALDRLYEMTQRIANKVVIRTNAADMRQSIMMAANDSSSAHAPDIVLGAGEWLFNSTNEANTRALVQALNHSCCYMFALGDRPLAWVESFAVSALRKHEDADVNRAIQLVTQEYLRPECRDSLQLRSCKQGSIEDRFRYPGTTNIAATQEVHGSGFAMLPTLELFRRSVRRQLPVRADMKPLFSEWASRSLLGGGSNLKPSA